MAMQQTRVLKKHQFLLFLYCDGQKNTLTTPIKQDRTD